MSFFSTQGTKFSLDGRTTRFTGTNSYYLGWASKQMVDDTFASARDLGIEVIRTWGFLDELKEGVVYQTWENDAPVYHEAGLAKLDYVVAKAEEIGIKLILPLSITGRILAESRLIKAGSALRHRSNSTPTQRPAKSTKIGAAL